MKDDAKQAYGEEAKIGESWKTEESGANMGYSQNRREIQDAS
jgi:hypothetical protein